MKRVLISKIKDSGRKVLVQGWVSKIRILGKLAFVEIRDRTGTIQCVSERKDSNSEVHKKLKKLTLESVVCIVGKVKNKGIRKVI